MRGKPAHDSLLDVMGPWPWYLLSTAALALALLLVVKLIAGAVERRDAPAGAAQEAISVSARAA